MKKGLEDFAKENVRRQLPGVHDKGFYRAFLEILWRDFIKPPFEDDFEPGTKQEFFHDHESERPRFLADMYYIDEEKRMIYFYEIEDTHPISRDKLRCMTRWIVDLGDEVGWHCRVIVTDRYGLNHRIVLAYEHSFGPETYPEEEIEFRFPRVFAPL